MLRKCTLPPPERLPNQRSLPFNWGALWHIMHSRDGSKYKRGKELPSDRFKTGFFSKQRTKFLEQLTVCGAMASPFIDFFLIYLEGFGSEGKPTVFLSNPSCPS